MAKGDSFFKNVMKDRYDAISVNTRINAGEYSVADLVKVYGSKRALAEAYAERRGVKLGSAQKALSRLERYEKGERGGDVRNAAKVKTDLQAIGQSKLGVKASSKAGGSSGMGGGTLYISGTVGVSGYGDDYEEDRDIDQNLDEDQADELAILAWEKGEDAATAYFDSIYGFDNMYIADADVAFYD